MQRPFALKFQSETATAWVYCLAVFFILFFIRYPTVVLGLDVTDEGYNLSNQFLAGEIGIDFVKIAPQWWFSDWIGACWLKMTNSYGLWGARMGGLLTCSLIAMLSMRLITFVYCPHWAILATFLSTSLYSQPGRILYYDSVPLLLFVLCGCCLMKMISNPLKIKWSLATGIALSALTLSKWTMMTALGIPLLVLFFHRQRSLQPYFVMYGTVLSCLALFCGYLWSHGVLGYYFSVSGLAQEHNQLSLHLFRWYWQLRTIVPLLLIFFGAPLLLYVKTKQLKPALSLFAGLLVLSMFLSLFRSKWFCPFADIQVVYILTYLFCALVSSWCVYLLWDSLSVQEFTLFLCAALFPLAQTLGSAAGLAKAPHGMWLLGTSMFCLLQRLSKQERFNACQPQLFSVSALLTIVFSYYGIWQGYFYMGRDCWDLSKLNTELTSPRLRGIYTTAQRQQSFDALVHEIQHYARRGDPIFAYFHIPMVYFASGTRPLGEMTWFEAFLSPQKTEEMWSQFSPSSPPVLIVKAKTDTLNPSWGLIPLSPFGYAESNPLQHDLLQQIAKIVDQKTRELWDLTLVWSNPDFELFTVRAWPQ
jgi:hypothetical protein